MSLSASCHRWFTVLTRREFPVTNSISSNMLIHDDHSQLFCVGRPCHKIRLSCCHTQSRFAFTWSLWSLWSLLATHVFRQTYQKSRKIPKKSCTKRPKKHFHPPFVLKTGENVFQNGIALLFGCGAALSRLPPDFTGINHLDKVHDKSSHLLSRCSTGCFLLKWFVWSFHFPWIYWI